METDLTPRIFYSGAIGPTQTHREKGREIAPIEKVVDINYQVRRIITEKPIFLLFILSIFEAIRKIPIFG